MTNETKSPPQVSWQDPKGTRSVPGGVTAALGFSASGIAAGIKSASDRLDLACIFADRPSPWAAALTTNRFAAAPVKLARALLRRGGPLQAILVNSGNANAATGPEGDRRARKVAAAVAKVLELPAGRVLVSSTGIIGRALPADLIVRAVPEAVRTLEVSGGNLAAQAIMTTDTFVKEAALELRIGGRKVRVGGMCKGAGMIHPNMATMLAYITTDAVVSQGLLRRLLSAAVERTFNRINIDGDQSTNDTVLLMAGGAAGARVPASGPDRERFAGALEEICRRLAELIVRDGEGATKLVEIAVTGARSAADAHRVADTVANSKLVKTAWFGQDLNWGRIAAAVGYAGVRVDPEKVAISLNGKAVVAGGRSVSPARIARAAKEMRKSVLRFVIDLGLGTGRDSVLTCDLTHDYVSINAEYPT
ncbi:MAG: bifunctional glutamate N-acetyltransferase/amino-acid acetyltransferase ArgJ [Candidatus Methylomirabilia bacterium]